MAKKTFLLQGFTPRTYREAILNLFDVDEVQRVIISVAFLNRGGVELLESELVKHAGKSTALIGIHGIHLFVSFCQELVLYFITIPVFWQCPPSE